MSLEKIRRAEEVYGINRDLPLNYVNRKSADEKLIDSLSRGKHLVIFGSSKQGKTCLRKHCLKPDDYILVHCSNRWGVAEVNSAILKAAGYEVNQSTVKAIAGNAKIQAKAGLRLFGTGAEGGGEGAVSTSTTTTRAPLELDPLDVNDIIRALSDINFAKFIILEDFHYLPIETQKDFSVALKAYHEASGYCFIVVGVWLEENRLSVYNGDLTGRVLSIDADKWTDEELSQVIELGESLLNIRFETNFRQSAIKACLGSVSLLQETCYRTCEMEGVYETQIEIRTLGVSQDPSEIVRRVVNDQSGRFNSFITQFAIGFEETDLHMYRWLLFPVLTSKGSSLEEGLGFRDVRKRIEGKHPKGKQLNAGSVLQALRYAAALQIKKDIKPIILDYDNSNSLLRVVDRSFIIWLENQDRANLLEMVDLPDPWAE